MTFEGSTSFVAADDVRLCKSSASVISPNDAHRRTLQGAVNVSSMILLAALSSSHTAVILYRKLH